MTSLKESCLMSRDSEGRWRFSTQLPNSETIILHHGVKSCQFEFPETYRQTNTFVIEPEIAQILSLPKFKTEYRVKPTQSGQWLLGPLVGVFINNDWLEELLLQRDIPICNFDAELLHWNQGLVVFFSLESINWNSGEVIGVIKDISDPLNVWKEQILPIPTVIYERCFRLEGRVGGITLRTNCASYSHNITIINPLSKLGKIQIYKMCSQKDSLRQNLPQWNLFCSESGASLLQKYPVAYIKPDRLSGGRGISKVTHTSNGFLIEQRRGALNYRHLCSTSDEVFDEITHGLNDCVMVIQEAIQLKRYKGRPFDFRLLLQKDRSGQWKQTGIVARICEEGSIISSPRSGGEVATYEAAMKDLPEEQQDNIKSALLKLAQEIAQMIDEQFGLHAELGFDLGVDIDGKVWLIEVNGKPLKVSLERLNNETVTRLANERPIEYAIYLTGFGCSAGGTLC